MPTSALGIVLFHYSQVLSIASYLGILIFSLKFFITFAFYSKVLFDFWAFYFGLRSNLFVLF